MKNSHLPVDEPPHGSDARRAVHYLPNAFFSSRGGSAAYHFGRDGWLANHSLRRAAQGGIYEVLLLNISAGRVKG